MRFFTVSTYLCEHINKALQINLIEIVLKHWLGKTVFWFVLHKIIEVGWQVFKEV